MSNSYIKSKKTIILGSLLIFILLSCTFSGCSFSKNKEGLLAPPLQQAPNINFFTFDVEKQEITREVRDVVKIEPATQTPIFSKYGGWLKKQHGKINEFVYKGDLLVEFDSDSLEIKLEQQILALEKAQINCNQVLEGISREIQLSKMDLNDIEESLTKNKTLRSDLLNDNSDVDVRSLSEQIEGLEKQVIRQKIIIEGLEEKHDITKASLEIDIINSEIQVENINKQLENTKLYAPKDGMIFYMAKIEDGEFVGAYRSLLTIVSIEDIQLKYTGMNANKFEVGMKVTFNLDKDELPGQVISAPSYYAKDMPSSVKESVIMNIQGLTVEKLLSLKSDIRVNLVLEHREDVVVVPRSILNNHIGNKYVYIIENGMKKQRFVETGVENNIDVEIVKGLNPGDKVVDS